MVTKIDSYAGAQHEGCRLFVSSCLTGRVLRLPRTELYPFPEFSACNLKVRAECASANGTTVQYRRHSREWSPVLTHSLPPIRTSQTHAIAPHRDVRPLQVPGS